MDEKNKDMLSYFLNLNYDVIVKRRQGVYIVVLKELSLIAKDERLDYAYKKIEMEKNKYIKEMIELGLSKSINKPKGEERTKAFSSVLYRFKAIFVIIFMLIGFVGIAGLIGYVGMVRAKYLITSDFILSKGKAFARTVSVKIENMPEERKSELKNKLHKLLEQLKPFRDEIKIFIEDSDRKKVEEQLSRRRR